jgi:hypothetical protein
VYFEYVYIYSNMYIYSLYIHIKKMFLKHNFESTWQSILHMVQMLLQCPLHLSYAEVSQQS